VSLRHCLAADIRFTAGSRGETRDLRTRRSLVRAGVRLLWVTDAFGAVVAHRLAGRARATKWPRTARVLDGLAGSMAQVRIGPNVVIAPGIYLPHGQVTIDGPVVIERNVAIRPWVTIDASRQHRQLLGPDGIPAAEPEVSEGVRIARGVRIGTGAMVLGPVHIGAGARVGANAVVTTDVPARATVVGVPGADASGAVSS